MNKCATERLQMCKIQQNFSFLFDDLLGFPLLRMNGPDSHSKVKFYNANDSHTPSNRRKYITLKAARSSTANTAVFPANKNETSSKTFLNNYKGKRLQEMKACSAFSHPKLYELSMSCMTTSPQNIGLLNERFGLL